MKLLIVEDDQQLAMAMKDALSDYDVTLCYNAQQAIREIEHPFDAYLLDIVLPDGNGLDLCRIIRKKSNSPVLIISSLTDEEQVLLGYGELADDYIEKPFRIRVLRAKLQSVLRRAGKTQDRLRWKDCVLDLNHLTLTRKEKQVSLNQTEAAIIKDLFTFPATPLQASILIQSTFAVTGKSMTMPTLSVRISEIRKKLASLGITIAGRRNTGFQLEML